MYTLFKFKKCTLKMESYFHVLEKIFCWEKFTAIFTGMLSHIPFLRTKSQLMLIRSYMEQR